MMRKKKALEHYLGAKLLELGGGGDVMIDIAAASSPWFEIAERMHGCTVNNKSIFILNKEDQCMNRLKTLPRTFLERFWGIKISRICSIHAPQLYLSSSIIKAAKRAGDYIGDYCEKEWGQVGNKNNRVMLVYPDYRSSDVFSGANLPVGLGYIAKALETAGIKYEVIDLNIDSIDDLIYRVGDFCPEFIGISMMSYRCKETYKLLRDVKCAFPKVKIIAGGPHVTANRERVLIECPAIDIGVVGEGEVAIVEIVRGDTLSTLKGVLYREGEAVRFTGERDFIYNLDEIPFPTYQGFKLENYGKYMQLASSRGCPYKCIFCGAPRILGKRWRKRSVQGMVEELEYWYEKGYRNFYFNDSNFAINKKRVSDFCDEVIKRNLNVCFTSDGLRADHVDWKLLEQMRWAGFTNLTFGAESGSNKVLRNLKKGETREQIESAIAAATDLGFHVTLFFLIGSPGEDVKDVEQSFQLALKYNVAGVYFFNLTPIPGTEFYDWAVKHGYLDESGGRYPEGNFGFSPKALLQTDAMTIDQIMQCLKQARHVERQIWVRHSLQEALRRLTGKEFPLSRGYLKTLSWFFSFRATAAVYIFFVRVAMRFFVIPKRFRYAILEGLNYG